MLITHKEEGFTLASFVLPVDHCDLPRMPEPQRSDRLRGAENTRKVGKSRGVCLLCCALLVSLDSGGGAEGMARLGWSWGLGSGVWVLGAGVSYHYRRVKVQVQNNYGSGGRAAELPSCRVGGLPSERLSGGSLNCLLCALI